MNLRTKTCKVCQIELPEKSFRKRGWETLADGTRIQRYTATCTRCHEAALLAKGSRPRAHRRNARGELRCADCGGYFPPDCFHTQSRRNDYRSYCRTCAPKRRKARAIKTASNPELWARELAYKAAYARKRRHAQQSQRRFFALETLRLLYERGWSQSAVSRRAGIAQQALIDWRHGQVPRAKTVKRLSDFFARVVAGEERPDPKHGGGQPPVRITREEVAAGLTGRIAEEAA